jgi:glycogen synthase
MRITLLSNEYPPHTYGGAGVHVSELSRELARLDGAGHAVTILCFGDQRQREENKTVTGIAPASDLPVQDLRYRSLLDALYRNVVMVGSVADADIVHCHTWYTHLAGCLLKRILAVPLVVTAHSLEPHRPWKREQLGSGYDASTWVEKTACQNADGIIAVSRSMRQDVHQLYGVPLEKMRVIHNGIDCTVFRPTFNNEVLRSYGISPHKPFLLFVGRITRQKGIVHLVDALHHLHPPVQVVLCAGAPDTEALGREIREKVEQARAETGHELIWIPEPIPREQLVTLYSHASLFVCPSVYEPFGIINLEAMACKTPVVAAAVGGIPEAVVHGKTGLLVPFEPAAPADPQPKQPQRYARDLAAAIASLLSSPDRMRAMAEESRRRVAEHFSWKHIARKTMDFYHTLLPRSSPGR